MRRSILLALALAIAPGLVHAGEDATSEYARIRASTPRTADAQAKLALWCEAHGLDAEKGRHLALALALEPRHALARGLMGLVEHRGRWLTPEGVAQSEREDAASAELRAEYVRHRDGAAMTAEGQWKLSEWCRAKGLDAEARAHAENVVRWEPGRDEAWQRLGYRKKDGRWMKPEEIERGRMELEAQQKADRQWAPKLKAWRQGLKSAVRREGVLAEMEGVSDPRAVPSILAVFAKGSGEEQRAGVRLLGQVDSVAATRALALLSVFGGDAEARRVAGELLRERDPREAIPPLIGLIRKPYKYELKPVSGPGGQGKLVVEGEKSNLERTYSAPLPQIPANGVLGRDPNTGRPAIVVPPAYSPAYQERYSRLVEESTFEQRPNPAGSILPGIVPAWDAVRALNPQSYSGMIQRDPTVRMGVFSTSLYASDIDLIHGIVEAFPGERRGAMVLDRTIFYRTFVHVDLEEVLTEAHRSAVAAGKQQAQDVELIQKINSDIHSLNDRARVVLKSLTENDLGDDREAWRSWWSDTILGMPYGLKSEPIPKIYENVTPYQPNVRPVITPFVDGTIASVSYHSCFAAGTSVQTMEGAKPIESIAVGDRVLSQDASTGALSYQPVVTTFHNPPQEVYRLKLDGDGGAEEILPTQHHRFWVSGRGWVMARHLKVGDQIRTLQGLREVESIAKDAAQPVFNLEVAETSSYFVGACGALAHDITLPKPVERPFDAE